jgi:hypothetical protein
MHAVRRTPKSRQKEMQMGNANPETQPNQNKKTAPCPCDPRASVSGLVERGGKKFAVALKSLKENSQEEIAASGPKTRIN